MENADRRSASVVMHPMLEWAIAAEKVKRARFSEGHGPQCECDSCEMLYHVFCVGIGEES